MQYGSFMFRNFRGDSPLEQLSGFALEAKEMQLLLSQGEPMPGAGSDVPPPRRAFVCIDEFGKGAEDAHAAALCAAVLRRMDLVCAAPPCRGAPGVAAVFCPAALCCAPWTGSGLLGVCGEHLHVGTTWMVAAEQHHAEGVCR